MTNSDNQKPDFNYNYVTWTKKAETFRNASNKMEFNVIYFLEVVYKRCELF